MMRTMRLAPAAACVVMAIPLTAISEPEFSVATGHFYEVRVYGPGADKTWDAANAAAALLTFEELPGHLATITSLEEDQFIDSLRVATPGINLTGLNGSELWVGGIQAPYSNDPGVGWSWITGEEIPGENGGPLYANWRTDNGEQVEPNDACGNDENHLAIGWSGQFVWNDEGCLEALHGYVVEYDYIPSNAVPDAAEATSGISKAIDVLANDDINNDIFDVRIEGDGPSVGTAVVGSGPEFLVTYEPPRDFANDPDDPEDVVTFQYRIIDDNDVVDDDNKAFSIATVTVKVLAGKAIVTTTGENQLIFDQALVSAPNSNNPLTASFSHVTNVAEGGGSVSISCCRVNDWREGAGRRGSYLIRNLDLGDALNHPENNLEENDGNCIEMPEIPQGMAVLRPWQRGVPLSKGLIDVDNPPSEDVGPNDLGVCVIESTGIEARGVVFAAEEAGNVLGYSLNGAVTTLKYRPFTGGVSIDPDEVDNPYVLPWTAEWDESRSGKRYSTNVMVVNLWHEWLILPSVPYLLQIAQGLRESIDDVELTCPTANTGGFLDELQSRMKRAMFDILVAALPWRRQSSGKDAVAELEDLTRLTLLIGPDAAGHGDPFAMCADEDNPEGLIAGRSMALTHAVCSELVQTFGDATIFGGVCRIPDDILCELPELPGFQHPASCSAP